MDKIKFIEEQKIKREAKKEKPTLATNPIKANLMRFIHFKLHKSEFKKDFE